ncbi:MAG: hypothetical protein SGARI_002773 [Bacillariaceae sp.]
MSSFINLSYETDPTGLHKSPAETYQSTNTMETQSDFWSSDDDEIDLKTGSSGGMDRSYDSDNELEDDPVREFRERHDVHCQ